MSCQAPYYYDYQNLCSVYKNPSFLRVADSGLTRFFKKYYLNMVFSVFDFTLPENWNKDYFLYNQFCLGYNIILAVNPFGIICQHGNLYNYGVYYQPTRATVVNPHIRGTKDLLIDKDCTVIKINPDYTGILDIVDYYAQMKAVASQALGVNLVNSKFAYAFGVKNTAQAETFKKMMDKIIDGDPAVFVDKTLLTSSGEPVWQQFDNNLSQNFIAPEINNLLQSIDNDFCEMIGIPNSNTDKKERMIVDEVNANNGRTHALCKLWLEHLEESFDKTRKLFGLSESELSVKLSRITQNERSENYDTGYKNNNIWNV